MPPLIQYPVGVEMGVKYKIVGPDGTVAVFNDPTDADFVGYLSDPPSGLERATVRDVGEDLSGADGGINGVNLYGRMPFTLQGFVHPDPAGTAVLREAKLMRATNAMRADAQLLWTPSPIGSLPVQVNFRQQQPTRLTNRRPKTFIVAGVSEDPCAFGQTAQSATLAPAVITSGGLTSPLLSPLLGAPGTFATVVVTNNGTIRTWPVLTLLGPIVNPTITNLTTGETIYLICTLGASDSLVLSSHPRLRTIVLNGTANRYGYRDATRSVWWALQPNANVITVGFSTVGVGAQLTIAYRDAWG